MIKHTVLAIVLASLMASCGQGPKKDIKINGSSTVYPITEAVAEEYRTEAPDTRVTVGVSGTGGGFKQFLRSETDINNASRSIKPSEIELAEQNEIDYLELSVAFDGIAVVVNPENDWANELTVEELKMIWEPAAQGEIMRWSQVRPEWPDEEIHLFGPGIASGTYDYFTEAIVGESGASRGDFTASEDDNVLVQGVSTDTYAIGFFGLAYFEENAGKLKLIAVDNGDGHPVKPSLETVKDGSYAPLSRPLFIYVSETAAEKDHVQDFIIYYLKNAGEFAPSVGYIPMQDEEYQIQLEKFESFISEQSQ
ncbi:MAG: PstS family phosphate ABC transporter substrate-binding protein [Gracilimonas sp.]|uniref:PstS family phosphate ABC transporter substrate-binding protein n=1 Tax=Gracilimonas sp. TaxID=1974203 RepID=UPI001982AB99|nr:PstS family phosphate ABC transporter substrate-binding protein [Gracilimonas sp.]MBD3617026.1 PstS family phosphate ABC transporter substrate-binding protein [Gracilimonas sp.]